MYFLYDFGLILYFYMILVDELFSTIIGWTRILEIRFKYQ